MIFDQTKEFGEKITKLINKEDLSRNETRDMFSEVLLNKQTEMQQGAFLAALRAKGETINEIAGCWEAIYELDTNKVCLETPGPVVENCGTGMDSVDTFNISTAASIIASAVGIYIARHGARAITSSCGTVDILEILGVDVECDIDIVKKSIEKAGIGIFNGMSPKIHPSALGRILSQISFGTTFNISASLSSPALPKYGVRGVYSKDLVNPVAQVMKEIGYRRAIVIHGLSEDGIHGMDEASTLGENFISELKEDGEIIDYSFKTEDIGIKKGNARSLIPCKDRVQEGIRLIRILSGKEIGPRLDIVCLNAALIFKLMNISDDLKIGFKKAKEIVNSGAAIKKLKDWVTEQSIDSKAAMSKLNNLFEKAEIYSED